MAWHLHDYELWYLFAKPVRFGHYVRVALLNPKIVLPFISVETGEARQTYFGYLTSMNTRTLKTFYYKGLKCISCGLEGTFFALEKHVKNKHNIFCPNLYGIDDQGRQVMFTKDHIIPKSMGGPTIFENLAPMCSICNNLKGATFEGEIYEKSKEFMKEQWF